ncbi:hypothetical protein LZI70_19840 (plasmid) [Vibrio pelagius]|uniref:Uncharacterized protein n=1 Tax=Vibrio pelagius TaxID=28169 RepID=A0ABY5GBC1_VIBPE|nr:hypothetical protein [Vibrio pelagius]UTT87275.1 hypothetical protein LZI70_19840 [Vibrio pelagius]
MECWLVPNPDVTQYVRLGFLRPLTLLWAQTHEEVQSSNCAFAGGIYFPEKVDSVFDVYTRDKS